MAAGLEESVLLGIETDDAARVVVVGHRDSQCLHRSLVLALEQIELFCFQPSLLVLLLSAM